MDKTTAAILVDYDYYVENPRVRTFVDERYKRASLVALVGTPNARHPDDEHLPSPPNGWNVTISNFKGHPDLAFKTSALDALQSYSNLYPALAIDLFNEDVYEEAGVLLYMSGVSFG